MNHILLFASICQVTVGFKVWNLPSAWNDESRRSNQTPADKVTFCLVLVQPDNQAMDNFLEGPYIIDTEKIWLNIEQNWNRQNPDRQRIDMSEKTDNR